MLTIHLIQSFKSTEALDPQHNKDPLRVNQSNSLHNASHIFYETIAGSHCKLTHKLDWQWHIFSQDYCELLLTSLLSFFLIGLATSKPPSTTFEHKIWKVLWQKRSRSVHFFYDVCDMFYMLDVGYTAVSVHMKRVRQGKGRPSSCSVQPFQI